MGLLHYLRNGLVRKLSGAERGRGRILVVENSQLGFDLGPLLARVLNIPFFDARVDSPIPSGRAVVSTNDSSLPHQHLLNLKGSFGEFLLEEMTGGVDIRIEALKISMQQLARGKRS